MLIVGLTGGSGCGKGYVSKLLAKEGIFSIDTDAVYHKMCYRNTPCMTELESHFGERIFFENGTLNRKALGAIVFADKDKLILLNHITHKYILAECELWLDARKDSGDYAAVIDAPVLFESGFDKHCDLIVSVLADREERIKRITSRDTITREEAEARINGQKTNEFYIENSDYILYNNDSDRIERQCAALAAELRRKSAAI